MGAEPHEPGRTGVIVLASGSRYRADLLAEVGITVEIDPPDIDERALDGRLAELGPAGLAVALARSKAAAVMGRHPGATIVAADQVGVLERPGEAPMLLTKQLDAEAAVHQLMAMSATTHRLVNGVVVVAPGGRFLDGVDVQTVTMRDYTEQQARSYVARFRPHDTSGSYRIEDQELLESERRGSGLIRVVAGEDPSGVVGLPLPLLGRLLRTATVARC